MKLKVIQTFTTLEDLKPLRRYKPLTTIKVSILNIPSEISLLLLSANLNYKAKQILDNQAKCKRGLCVDMYIYKAIEVMKITEDYANKYISNKDFKSIKSKFGLDSLYK